MQVLLGEDEYEKVRLISKARGMTVAEWVRQTLRLAVRHEPSQDVDRKLAAIRAATANEFPAPDIERMLAEIERGYLGRGAP